MLLPEAFERAPPPEALLAWDEKGRVPLGAAAYSVLERALMVRRLRVIRGHRREGVGSALIAHLAAIASERALPALRCQADTLGKPEIEAFLSANGFAARGCLWTARIEAEAALKILLPLRERWVAAGRIPREARLVHPADAPLAEVASLCAAHMESEWSVHPAYFGAAIYAKAHEHSFVLMVGERVAGLLIVEGAPGVETARIIAHVIAPEFRRGWANSFLLATALERAAAAGVRSVRFEALYGNLDTLNLIRRLGGEMVGSTKRFERPVGR